MGERKQPGEVENRKRPNEPGMESAEDHADDGTDLGAVRVHHGVIAVIARLAAMQVPGVVDMSGSFTDGIASMIGKNAVDRGIKVTTEGQSVSVELNLVIEYGVRIPQVAWRIQNDVRRAIEDMTGKKVKVVDVVIQGVRCSAAKKQEGAIS